MYKRRSPEALYLASLGRADSKRPDKTCRGITTAGKPCRKPIKTGNREKYCHLHRDQQSTYRAKLLGARTTTVTVVEEYDDDITNANQYAGYPTPEPSPLPSQRTFPVRKPVPSARFPPKQSARLPSLQLSPPQSTTPPTPPLSIQSLNLKSVRQQEKKSFHKLGKAIRSIFRGNSAKSETTVPLQYSPSLGTTLQRNDILPTRYPRTPLLQSPSRATGKHSHQITLPPSPQRTPRQLKSSHMNAPVLQGRPPTAVLALAQSRTATSGIQKSWETMWVPGIDGLGAHIICKGKFRSCSI